MKRILVIECDKDIALSLKEVLEGEGCEVDLALNVSEAQKKLDSTHYNKVIADHWTIRIDNGFDLVAMLDPSLLYILSSCAGFLPELSTLKCNKVIKKPCELSEVLDCL